MKLEEAIPLLQGACGKRLGTLFEGHPRDLVTNKGHVGGLLEAYIGLNAGRELLDFEDGELKTNKSRSNGDPLETMAITTLLASMDTLLEPQSVDFLESNVYKKLRNLVYLPVVKESPDPSDWYFVDVVHIRVEPGSLVFLALQEDYDAIKEAFHHQLELGDMLHTANGPNRFLQVRTKDGIPYKPIYSAKRGRVVSDKNRAFYFRKEFLRAARQRLFS